MVINLYEYLAFLCAWYALDGLGAYEKLTTGVVCKKRFTDALDVNYEFVRGAFSLFGLTAPASIEKVTTVLTTHNHAQLIAMNPFP